MPSQQDIAATAATQTAQTAQSAKPIPPAPPAQPAAQPRFTEECIILVLSPRGTVHPFVDKTPGKPGVRIFNTAELAALELQTNVLLSSHPAAIVSLKELFG